MSITKLSPNWAYQMGPIHLINFLLSGTDWETLVYGIMGWGLFVCMYLCIHVCMHKCVYIYVYVCIMYVLCMHNTYICVYVCMYTNTNQIYNARNVTPKCESQARNHIYIMHVCTQ